jgi:group I intron endonuclease
MIYYTIYKVTNIVTGKIYIGSHKTKDINDSYMGSGKYLKYSQAKHGIENFEKEILHVFDTPELMYAKEAELVNEEFIAEENTYNLKVGGFGGFDYLNREGYDNPAHTHKHMNKMKLIRTKLYPNGTLYGKNHSAKTKAQMSVTKKLLNNQHFLGMTHTDATKAKMSNSKRVTSKGERNSQYGTRWIHSTELKTSKKISKEDTIPEGWNVGRKIKWKT